MVNKQVAPLREDLRGVGWVSLVLPGPWQGPTTLIQYPYNRALGPILSMVEGKRRVTNTKLRMLFTTLMLSGQAMGCAEGDRDMDDICGPVGGDGTIATDSWPTIPDYFNASEERDGLGETTAGKSASHGQSTNMGLGLGVGGGGKPTYPGLDYPTPSPSSKKLGQEQRPIRQTIIPDPRISPSPPSPKELNSAGWVDF